MVSETVSIFEANETVANGQVPVKIDQGPIQVFLRIRPLTETEEKISREHTITIISPSSVSFQAPEVS